MRGRRKDAIRDRDRGLALAMRRRINGARSRTLSTSAARVDVALGDRDAAIAELSTILEKPYVISAAWLRIDPTWNPLRGDARFEKLAHSDGR